MKVLITDYAWPSVEPERSILAGAGAEVVVVETAGEDELAQLAVDADGILTCWKPVTEKVIRAAENCVSIGRYGIGLDNIDVDCATRLGIVVTNVPAYCVEEVSEHALALLLTLARKTAVYDRSIKAGMYNLQAGGPLYRVRGKTLGIVGLGRIGRRLAEKACCLGLRTIAFDPNLSAADVEGSGVELVSFPALLASSDYISIHVPLTDATRRLFDAGAFRQMKPTAFLINSSRGSVIDESALLEALDEGRLAGTGLDVLDREPPAPFDPLTSHPKSVVTPHAAFSSQESLLELQTTAATQMAEILLGKRPRNIVNPA
ncbi:MAG: C-terminal binding protein, partial [Vicinamibacteraceae bacterium]